MFTRISTSIKSIIEYAVNRYRNDDREMIIDLGGQFPVLQARDRVNRGRQHRLYFVEPVQPQRLIEVQGSGNMHLPFGQGIGDQSGGNSDAKDSQENSLSQELLDHIEHMDSLKESI